MSGPGSRRKFSIDQAILSVPTSQRISAVAATPAAKVRFFPRRAIAMTKRELIEPNPGDKRSATKPQAQEASSRFVAQF